MLSALGAAACGLSLGPSPLVIYTSDVCVGHDPGSRFGQVLPEQPARLENLLEALRGEWAAEFGELLKIREPDADITREQLLRVHTPSNLDRIDGAFANSRPRPGSTIRVRVNLDRDTVIQEPGSQAAANRAAGLVVAAVDDLLSPGGQHASAVPNRAFVMVRPPGHHAEAGSAGGFCIYNNVMVGVAHAQAVHGLSRVAILDFDVHHGNGDSDIAWCDPTRLYVSSFETGIFGGLDVVKRCDGLHGQILSAPLPANAGSSEFRHAWASELLPAVRAFEPEAIFLSAGFDAHADDPLASLTLSEDDFTWITAEVGALACELGDLPIVSVLEGGYNIDALERSARAHVRALIHSSDPARACP